MFLTVRDKASISGRMKRTTALLFGLCAAACNGSATDATPKPEARPARAAADTTTARTAAPAASGAAPAASSAAPEGPPSTKAIQALSPKRGSIPAGYAWEAKTWPGWYIGWEAKKNGDAIVRLDVIDCRSPTIFTGPSNNLPDGRAHEPACVKPPSEKWKGYPVERTKGETLKLRVGNLIVAARASNPSSPYASDAKLEEAIELLDLAALAKL